MNFCDVFNLIDFVRNISIHDNANWSPSLSDSFLGLGTDETEQAFRIVDNFLGFNKLFVPSIVFQLRTLLKSADDLNSYMIKCSILILIPENESLWNSMDHLLHVTRLALQLHPKSASTWNSRLRLNPDFEMEIKFCLDLQNRQKFPYELLAYIVSLSTSQPHSIECYRKTLSLYIDLSKSQPLWAGPWEVGVSLCRKIENDTKIDSEVQKDLVNDFCIKLCSVVHLFASEDFSFQSETSIYGSMHEALLRCSDLMKNTIRQELGNDIFSKCFAV